MQNIGYPLPAEALQNGSVHTNSVFGIAQPDQAPDPEPANRMVKRNLRSIHIFLIVISGTIGMGLFENSGEILAIAGAGGGITAFILVGFGVIMIMEGVAEMVTHWPISNAMIEFVRVFIDKELAIVIGFAYAYAYSISFSTLIVAASELASHWIWPANLQDIVFILIVPIVLLGLNCYGVLWYGNIESFCGVLKIGLVVSSFVIMCVLNHLEVVPEGVNTKCMNVPPFIVAPANKKDVQVISEGFQNNPAIANSAAIATLVAFPIATYAYLGVEIVAVTAVEARDPTKSLRFPARNIAWITTVMYSASVVAFYFDVSWQDSRLPPYHGRISNSAAAMTNSTGSTPSSLVVIACLNANKVPLSNALNGFLIMAVLSAANTALYVSSRTLWGLACHLDPRISLDQSILRKWVLKLSNTTPGSKVPGWALIVCTFTFWWLIPFSQLDTSSSALNVSEIMSGAATNAVILVWASQCVAFIRYRGWLWEYRANLTENYSQYDHYNNSEASKPFNSGIGFTQRLPAVVGLIFCFATAIIFSTSSWWDGYRNAVDIVSAFVGFVLLFIFWLLLKLWRRLSGADFEWCVHVTSWNSLQKKLDGLTNAIHTRDYNEGAPQPATIPMYGLARSPPSQTPLMDQTRGFRGLPQNLPPTPDERQDALGIMHTSQYPSGNNPGYFGQMPMENQVPMAYAGQDMQAGEQAYLQDHQGGQWRSSSGADSSHDYQPVRRRSVSENYRRN